jgi:8-oxo-dGTP pyrophosphatase MutT (NUDIX family)
MADYPFQGLPSINNLVPTMETWTADMHARASAVLMLFIPDDDPLAPARIVFTRRSTQVRTHKGQIGFPGGRREASDANPVVTALRECQEEIGLAADQVKLIGCLPPLPGLDRRSIVPVIGMSRVQLSAFAASPDEVAELFALPWPLFTSLAMQNLRFNVFGRWRETPYFPAAGYHVWGLTAWILKQAELRAED